MNEIGVGAAIAAGNQAEKGKEISLAKLIEGGVEILAAINKNHQNVILGNELNKPLNEITFVCDVLNKLYILIKNNADDDIP
ncbi:hypothetical protein CEXT_785031 [Caerostris extrusa]|uniref:Uncharacterized protein n=1 Tax=Caerostris extrusa TaxID=172846 RepID=A0AAV4SIW6_CAEEX|nr:hypothetical protein CEXT_785031 [Caerostris extrusa]